MRPAVAGERDSCLAHPRYLFAARKKKKKKEISPTLPTFHESRQQQHSRSPGDELPPLFENVLLPRWPPQTPFCECCLKTSPGLLRWWEGAGSTVGKDTKETPHPLLLRNCVGACECVHKWKVVWCP